MGESSKLDPASTELRDVGEPLLKNEDMPFRVRRQNSKKKDLTQVTTKPEADTRRLGSGCPMIYVFMAIT